jgi:hypothetical protein
MGYGYRALNENLRPLQRYLRAQREMTQFGVE